MKPSCDYPEPSEPMTEGKWKVEAQRQKARAVEFRREVRRYQLRFQQIQKLLDEMAEGGDEMLEGGE